jgi:uncharacterized protein (TIGR03437 family)
VLNVIALLAASAAGHSTWADSSSLLSAPSYSQASIVNAASNVPGALAPNTLATIYGSGLSYVTVAITPAELGAGLPTALRGAGVRVLTCGIPSPLYFVSPSQINFLVPAELSAGNCGVQVIRESLAGPVVAVTLFDAWPALFTADGQVPAATTADGLTVTAGKPVHPGDVVVLYGTGFGQTSPPISDGLIPRFAARTEQPIQILLDGKLVESGVLYAGITPGFGGLYQINLIIPAETAANPEVVVWIAGRASQSSVRLPLCLP